MTKTTGSKQRHLADLTFKQVNATVDLHSSDVPSTEQRNYKYYLKSCCVLQDHYDDERDKTVFHNTTPDCKTRPRPMFWSQTGLVLRSTVSDHITDNKESRVDCNSTALRLVDNRQ